MATNEKKLSVYHLVKRLAELSEFSTSLVGLSQSYQRCALIKVLTIKPQTRA